MTLSFSKPLNASPPPGRGAEFSTSFDTDEISVSHHLLQKIYVYTHTQVKTFHAEVGNSLMLPGEGGWPN
jgi:hypothetical protein